MSAILLAAGESTRMGRQKALLNWHGTTLLEYQLKQLTAVGVAEIVVVTGHEADAINDIVSRFPLARTAHNAAYKGGKVGSILTGLGEISPEATVVLLLAVDQPRWATVLFELVDRHVRSGMRITVPAFDGRRGHPVLFDRSLLPELLAIDEATQGIRAVMQRHEAQTNAVDLPNASLLLDLNTPDDLAATQYPLN